MRVLIVEDEDTLREQICERFKNDGFAIDATGDGEEGLYLAREMPVDVAVIDLGLPGPVSCTHLTLPTICSV